MGHQYTPSGTGLARFTCTCGKHVSEHPDKYDFFESDRFRTILEYGHQVMYIFPTDEEPGHVFGYTVGRSLWGKPEILMTGPLPMEVMHRLINDAADLQDEGKLEPGTTNDELIQGFGAKIIAVTDPAEAQMFQALYEFPDQKVTAVQILWPDPHGRFPGEPGCEYGPDVQPMFG